MRKICLGLAFAVSIHAQNFRLESERRETYGVSGAKTETFTAYDYDAQGNRAAKRAFLGADTAGKGLGVTAYTYGPSGRLEREVSTIGADTVSDAAYQYDLGPDPVRIDVRGAGGKPRYTDVFNYASGNLITEARLSSAGKPMYERHYGYDGSRLTADSLFETVDSALANTQVRSLSYNGDGTVAEEAHARLDNAAWVIWERVKMRYQGGRLIAAVDFEGAKRMDSVAYHYDGAGNRSDQRRVNDEGDEVEAIFYSWHELPLAVRARVSALRSRGGETGFNLLGRSLSAQPLHTLFIQETK